MTAFLTDNFTGTGAATAHVADSGQGWVDNIAGGTMIYGHNPSGQPIISGGVLQVTAAGDWGEIWSDTLAPTADYYVEAAIHRVWQSGHGERTAIGIRMGGTNSSNFNGYAVEITPASTSSNTGNWNLNLLAGALSIGTATFTPGAADFTVRIQAVGTALTVSANGGADLISVTSSTFAAAGAPLLYVETNAGGSVANNTITSVSAVNLGTPPAAAFWTDFVLTSETF